MKVMVVGGSFINKGAEAMLRTVQAELSARVPGIQFCLWRLPAGYHCLAADNGFIPLTLPLEGRKFSSGTKAAALRKAIWSLGEIVRGRDLGPAKAWFSKRDLLAMACRNFLDRTTGGLAAMVDISGFAYGDQLGESRFRMIEPLRAYFTHRNRPAVFLPQAWGSFAGPGMRREILRLLGGERTIFYSRDEVSCSFLEKALSRPAGSIRPAPDIAFAFAGGGGVQGQTLLEKMGCMRKRPIIGVAPNMRVYERLAGKGLDNSYLQALTRLAAHCLERHEVDIVLQANEIDSFGSRLDDRHLCSLIAAALNRPDRCFWTSEPLSAAETKALIGCFDFLIGSRFHSFVFGFSQGVPGLAVSWLHKYRELFSQFGLEENVQECQELNVNALIKKFEKAWRERKTSGPEIQARAERIRRGVGSLFDEVADQIHGA